MASRLAIFDLKTGHTETVLVSSNIIEAPNWMPDNSALIINSKGAIYRVPLTKPKMQLVDTGFAKRCNNDHGVSCDGQFLAISDETEFASSCIYTLPITGGTPKRITAQNYKSQNIHKKPPPNCFRGGYPSLSPQGTNVRWCLDGVPDTGRGTGA